MPPCKWGETLRGTAPKNPAKGSMTLWNPIYDGACAVIEIKYILC